MMIRRSCNQRSTRISSMRHLYSGMAYCAILLLVVADAASQPQMTSIVRNENGDGNLYQNDIDGIANVRRNRLQLHRDEQLRRLKKHGVKGPRKKEIDDVSKEDMVLMRNGKDKQGKKVKLGKSSSYYDTQGKTPKQLEKEGYVCVEYAMPKSGKMAKTGTGKSGKGSTVEEGSSKGSKRHLALLTNDKLANGEAKFELDEAHENRRDLKKKRDDNEDRVVMMAKSSKEEYDYETTNQDAVCVKWELVIEIETHMPTELPTMIPTLVPTLVPTLQPTIVEIITLDPTLLPTLQPTLFPTIAEKPDVVDDSLTMNENEGTVCVDVLDNDTPPNGQTLLVTKVTGGDYGVCSISPDSTKVCYTPGLGFVGKDECEYTACDDQEPPQCSTARVGPIIVEAKPTYMPTLQPTSADKPVAIDDKVNVPSDTGTTCFDVLENDIPGIGQTTLFVTKVTGGDNGVCSISPDSTKVCYSPDTGFSGQDSCTYTACDEQDPPQCDEAEVEITVGLPFVEDDAITINNVDGKVCVPVLDNATPVPGTTLSVTSVTGGKNGECSINGSDPTEVCYESKLDFTGVDECQFESCDDQDPPICAPLATATFTVIGDNSDTMPNDGTTTTCVPVLTDTPDLTLTTVTGGDNGKCTPSLDGIEICYTPAAGFAGKDRCEYTACDDEDECASGTVTIDVIPDDEVTMDAQDGIICATVIFSPDLTLTDVTGGDNGKCTPSADGKQVCYTPDAGFAGLDECDYEACNSEGKCAMASVTVTVIAKPTSGPSLSPTASPTASPTEIPTAIPTSNPSFAPTSVPTSTPTSAPSLPYKCILKGGAITEYWWNIPGLTIDSLISGTNNFQKPPDLSIINTDKLEIPPNRIDPETGQPVDNYGTRIKGFIVPPVTGAYTFWIASDDQGQFSLSTTEFRNELAKICYVTLWVTDTLEYDKYPEQKSAPVNLIAGELYYYEALMKEGPLEDYLSIAWQVPGKSREMVPGEYLYGCTDPNFNYEGKKERQ